MNTPSRLVLRLYFMSSRFITALNRLQQPSFFVVALLAGVFLLLIGGLSSLAVHSGQIVSELRAGYYSLSRPLVISSSPLLRVEKGTVKFLAQETQDDKGSSFIKARLFGILPSQWTELFTEQKLTDLTLQDAVLTLDLRGTPSERVDPQRAIGLALKNSYLENVTLVDSSLILLQDFAKPKTIIIKQGSFNIDLPDREFDGKGLLNIDGMETRFTLENDFSKQDGDGAVINQIKLDLNSDVFSGYFKGAMAGRHGLFLKGKADFKTSDAGLLSGWLGIRDTEDLKPDRNKTASDEEPLNFSVSGQLDWSMNEGTLSDCSFGFNENMASGSISLRLSQSNPEISGTLAFPMLDLSPQTHLLGLSDEALKALPAEDTESAAQPPAHSTMRVNEQLGKTASYLYKLIRNFDADIRMSAQTLKIGKIELEETGFSLFQRKGEFIVDMAGVTLFDGHATGLIKIDTNFPKPRWHMNVSFNNIEVSKLSSAIGTPAFLNGVGDMKVHITSYGDKITELYQNMFGALNYSMNKGGVIALDMKRFIGEQELSSDEELEMLSKGSSQFSLFSSKGHFSKGSVFLDHFTLNADDNEYTGQGNWHIPSQKLDMHIASWPIVSLKAGAAIASDNVADNHTEKAAAGENKQGAETSKNSPRKADEGVDGDKSLKPDDEITEMNDGSEDTTAGSEAEKSSEITPELLACSHIYGPIGQFHLSKLTGVHLSLLKRDCAAPYRLQPLKTKGHPIVRSDNAG